MCGIAGLAGRSPGRRRVLETISDDLRHRGPDESGIYDDEMVSLAIRRLAIIDVAGGHQPYHNESGTVHVVFNGEIYGFRALRERLQRAGHRFASDTDGEVIAHAYEEHGAAFVSELDGMFALALWDATERRLILARDRLGKKPLFYSQPAPGCLTFASELGSLLLDERIPRRVEPAALAEYLQYGYVPSPRTMLQGVLKLEPGTMLTWRPGEPARVHRYWQLDFEPKLSLSYAEALDEFEERSREAVRARLISDVPLGVFLSGGVDSSYVLAQMAAAGASDIQSFAIGFADARYDERSHAEKIAELLGSTHHEAVVEPTDLTEMLPELVHHYGEPFSDPSMVPTFYLARWARRRITVALTGEGGDELFGGYYRHQAVRLAGYADHLPDGARRLAGVAAHRLEPRGAHPMSLRHRGYRFLRSVALHPRERYAEWTAVLSPAERAALAPGLGAAEPFDPPGVARRPLDRALATDLARSMPDQLLFKMDIATMASSLEARAPLLDYRLAEWAARLPPSFKQRGTTRKRLIADALARHVPAELFKRPKMGFTAPIPAWLRGELYELTTDTLLGAAARERGIADPAEVERLIAEHRAGTEHTRGLWSLLMLELWHQEFIDRKPASRAHSAASV
ncbi:MAG: asparagine synthase (glutamine-hydrolyzing) [Solirubrobacterales bacterium]|nr:asparagine synthase (glutamine-hydrolyzing) [Solirubrobacterales bacterium]